MLHHKPCERIVDPGDDGIGARNKSVAVVNDGYI
jgi:hypothetical protein